MPKITQLVESRLHTWFDERCVEPRFQQIVLPSLWPRKKTTRGGHEEPMQDGPRDPESTDDGRAEAEASERVAREQDRQRSLELEREHEGLRRRDWGGSEMPGALPGMTMA